MSPAPLSTNSTSTNSATPPTGPVNPDELLPPVEPPSASFILQLFIIPAVIVLVVVLLWLLVTSLASRGEEDPSHIVAALRSSNQNRWQKAMELADMLRMDERYPNLKTNSELAEQLAQFLEEEVDAAEENENSIEMRYFLCRVLGEFNVDNGLKSLLKVAREDSQRDVRREAINALAVLGHNFSNLDPPRPLVHPDLFATLSQLAQDKDELIRSQTAFALGTIIIDSSLEEQVLELLETLVDDLYCDARYNAALALARRGDLRAVETVVEMLDAQRIAISVEAEETPGLRAYKRDILLKNALTAARSLLQQNPQLALSEIEQAVQRFVDSAPQWREPAPVPKSLIQQGRELLVEPAPAG